MTQPSSSPMVAPLLYCRTPIATMLILHYCLHYCYVVDDVTDDVMSMVGPP